MKSKCLVLLLAPLALLGCDSTMPLAHVATEVQVSPSVLIPGQIAELTVVATNWGEETVYASNGCAPGLGFMITPPAGQSINPYPAAWPCASEDSHLLEPGETDAVVFRWTVPQMAGRYQVVGGVVVGDRLWAISEPVAFEVRAGE